MRDTVAFQSVAAVIVVVNLIVGLAGAFPPHKAAKMTTISAQPCQTFGHDGCEIIPERAVSWR